MVVMALQPDDVDIDERKSAGRAAAIAAGATEHKPFGQTSPESYPFTYWFVVGFNEGVDELEAQS